MTYRYRFSGPAESRFAHLSQRDQERIIARIQELCSDPYTPGISKALKGQLAGVRSSRVGPRRILYEIDEQIAVLTVLDIGPRGDIYKRR